MTTVTRTIVSITLTLLMIGLSALSLQAAQAGFSWLSNTEPNLTGYKIHYGTSSRNYSSVIDVGLPNTVDGEIVASVEELEEGQTYYFAETAYWATEESDTCGEQSTTMVDGV